MRFLTALYAFRLVFVVFFGPQRTEVVRLPGWRMKMPLVVLSVLALVAGFLWLPSWMGGWSPLASFLQTALPPTHFVEGTWRTGFLGIVETPVLGVLGVLLAWWLYLPPLPAASRRSPRWRASGCGLGLRHGLRRAVRAALCTGSRASRAAT